MAYLHMESTFMNISLRSIQYALFGVLLGAARGTEAEPSLKNAATDHFMMGVGIRDHIPEHPDDWPLLLKHFSVVTPENSFKPDPVHVTEGQYRFDVPDAFVEFAERHRLQVVGHCLVWAKDDRTPPWFYSKDGRDVSKEVLLARMDEHIKTVVGRYQGRIAMWDVVNEALDDGSGYLRASGWTRICGDEFIARAFETAHAADPKARLIYNDYNNELDGKREKMLQLVEWMRTRNLPVHAIGLQGHYEIDRVPYDQLRTTLEAMRKLRMNVVISELDIDVIPRGGWWADHGAHREEMKAINPYTEGCPPDVLQRQAEQYAALFVLFREYSDVIERVSFWNLHDGESWLNNFPWKRDNHPLLFDRNRQPKPAFPAVIDALMRSTIR
jgi:endo-1,4-beta-xylanase